MTMFKPNLAVNRMSVFKSGQHAYSEKFHSGLNIIRGENSSGKSTIMDFIFYGLGGDLSSSQWRDKASVCDEVVMETSLNGQPVTLLREIDTASSRPLKIYFGEYEEAMSSRSSGWEVYPYRRGNKESFSQVLFRLLGLPEVQYGDQNTKVTMNQLLRLLYSDQLSPVEKIFRAQTFDDAITRQTVGDLLCGVYSEKFYTAKLRKKVAEEELKDVNTKIKSLIKSHKSQGHPLTMEWLDQEKRSLESQLEALNNQIADLEAEIFNAQFSDRLSLNDQKATYETVVSLQAIIGELTEKIDKEKLDFEDSAFFIDALDSKISQLNESAVVVEQFKNLSFEFCPACYCPLETEVSQNACKLCKSPYDHDLTRKRSVRLINEYQRQHDQSQLLQNNREERIAELEIELSLATEKWNQASEHYRVAVKTPTTELRTELRKLNRDAGYLYRTIEELNLKKAIIEEIEELETKAEALDIELKKLKKVLFSETNRMQDQRILAYSKISDTALQLLKLDLERQSTFTQADYFKFEFDADRMSVNDESFFSASSMVYMKNSFLAAFLYSSANSTSFSYPRFLLMDTIEDKGMEPERSQNFQIQLAEMSSEAKSEHQIIIATSMIAPELNIDDYTVGDFYTHENRSLKLLGR